MIIISEYDINRKDWVEKSRPTRMGLRITTGLDTFELSETEDGHLSLRSVNGPLVLAPQTSNQLAVSEGTY